MKRRALFLDRDGVINVDHGYVFKQEQFQFIEGAVELCRYARELGYLLFVVTNQAGIARGLFTEGDFTRLTNWMCSVLAERGAVIDKVYYCPFHPEHGIGAYKVDSPLRKPRPGMFLQAAQEFGVDLPRSVSVGDKETDIQAAAAAGVASNLRYCPSNEKLPGSSAASAIVRSLNEVVPFLRRAAGLPAAGLG